MQFYLMIALVVLVAGRKGLWILWPACLAITFLRINNGAYVSVNTHLRVDEILSGACVATLHLQHNHIKFGALRAVLFIAALLWAVSAHPLAGSLQYLRPYTTAFLLFASLHYGAAYPGTLLASGPLRYIAAISYALYVIHPATAHGWMSEGSKITEYLFKRPISFALTFTLAHISTFYWERRWQLAARRWLQNRGSVTSAEIAIAPAPQKLNVGPDSDVA